MMRVLAIVIATVSAVASVQAQTGRRSQARYVEGHGICGPVYMLEDAPSYFDHPKTAVQILEVIRVLKSAPPQADVKCYDLTDAWLPYLYADRKVEIARLLIRLKRYDEAREELWTLFLREGVLYRGRKLHYSMHVDKATSLLISDELWNAADLERRLGDLRYQWVEEVKAAREKRKRLPPSSNLKA